MESQPQNPEFRNNPENFHPCIERADRVLMRMTGYWLIYRFSLTLLTCIIAYLRTLVKSVY